VSGQNLQLAEKVSPSLFLRQGTTLQLAEKSSLRPAL
jgi:hypothetical protein